MAKDRYSDLIDEELRKNEGMESCTLARKIYKKYPMCFPTMENVRNRIRHRRGRLGKQNRQHMSSDEFLLPEPTSDNPLSLPESDTEEYLPYNIQGERILVLPDVHIPFHCIKETTLALKYGQERDADCILLNGDLMDFFKVSSFRDRIGYTRFEFEDEIEKGKQFLAVLRNLFPKANMVWKEGNHERRLVNYMKDKAPELLGVREFHLDLIMNLPDFGISYVEDQRRILAGKTLNILHGDELRSSSSVNPARGMFLKGKANILSSHTHRTSQHTETTLDGKLLSCWSTGCLSELHPKYNRHSQYNHGFAYVEVRGDHDFMVHNKRILNGKII